MENYTMEENNYLEWINDAGVLNIPNNVTEIPSEAFRNNQTIKAIRCANSSSLKSIGDYAFANCVNLISITFPVGLQTIGKNAFAGCSSLQSIVIHKRIKMIDSCAFKDCIKLTEVELETVGALEYMDFGHDSMIYENKRYIENSKQMLKVNRGLLASSNVAPLAVLPDPVKIQRALMQSIIGDHAFENCQSLTWIRIPNQVKKIGDYAFAGCSNLQLVDLSWMSFEAVIGLNSFMDCPPTTKYYFLHMNQKRKLLVMNRVIKPNQVIRRVIFGKHFKIHPGLFIFLVSAICVFLGFSPLFALLHKP